MSKSVKKIMSRRPTRGLKPAERLKIVQQRQGYLSLAKWVLGALFILGCVLGIYQLWFRDAYLLRATVSSSVALPSRQEVLEKRVINPVYKSFDAQNMPFTLKALSSTEVDESHVYLQDPMGVYYKDETEPPMVLKADEGTINKQTDELNLEGHIQLTQGDMVITAKNFHLNIKSQEGYTYEGIQANSPGKKIEAGHFEVRDRGDMLILRQGSAPSQPHITLLPQDKLPQGNVKEPNPAPSPSKPSDAIREGRNVGVAK